MVQYINPNKTRITIIVDGLNGHKIPKEKIHISIKRTDKLINENVVL